MISNLKLITLLQTTFFILLCSLTSFFNYLLTQIIGGYFVPLTALAILFYSISGRYIPLVFVFIIGIIDDILLNSPLGTYALTYSILLFILSIQMKKLKNKKFLVFVISAIFLLINFVTFCRFY